MSIGVLFFFFFRNLKFKMKIDTLTFMLLIKWDIYIAIFFKDSMQT